ncbi:MAG: ABC transporter permease, partial [Bacilli bacterium]
AINKTISLSNFWLGRYFFLYEDNDITNFELFDEEREKPEELKDLEIKTDEILVSSALYSRNGRQKTLEINGFVFDIIGIYDYRSLSDESIYIKKNQLDRVYEINLLGNRPVYYISDDIENDLTSLKANFYDAYHVYDIDYQTNMILDKDTTALFYSMIVGLFTLVFLYFIMRSSVISRSYSIGVLRALGVSRWNVIGIFVFEVILITLLSSFIGVTLFSIITIQINSISSLFYYPWYVPLFTFLMILIFNILIGILPVLPYLRKTPSQILSRFDM